MNFIKRIPNYRVFAKVEYIRLDLLQIRYHHKGLDSTTNASGKTAVSIVSTFYELG